MRKDYRPRNTFAERVHVCRLCSGLVWHHESHKASSRAYYHVACFVDRHGWTRIIEKDNGWSAYHAATVAAHHALVATDAAIGGRA